MDVITAEWSGWVGAPGFSNFYFQGDNDSAGLDNCAGRVREFFNGIKPNIPTGVTIKINPVVRKVTSADGAVYGLVSLATVPANVVGTDTGAYSAVTGCVVQWRTGVSVGSRILVGRSFIVPLGGGSYDTTGTLGGTLFNNFDSVKTQLVVQAGAAARDLVVWHRPNGENAGSTGKVIAAVIPDKAAILRSRRT